MGHEGRAMSGEQIQRLLVGQVAVRAADAFLQVVGVLAIGEHLVVIVGLEEHGMALREMVDDMFTRFAYIGEDTYVGAVAADNEAVRIGSIVELREGHDRKITDSNRLVGHKAMRQVLLHPHAAIAISARSHIYGQLVLERNALDAPDVVAVLVGDEYGFYLGHVQPQALHSLVGLAAGEACIYQYRLMLITYVIAVGIAA